MVGHGRWVCSCGAVIMQCRCMEGHGRVTVVANGCDQCKAQAKVKVAHTTGTAGDNGTCGVIYPGGDGRPCPHPACKPGGRCKYHGGR